MSLSTCTIHGDQDALSCAECDKGVDAKVLEARAIPSSSPTTSLDMKSAIDAAVKEALAAQAKQPVNPAPVA